MTHSPAARAGFVLQLLVSFAQCVKWAIHAVNPLSALAPRHVVASFIRIASHPKVRRDAYSVQQFCALPDGNGIRWVTFGDPLHVRLSAYYSALPFGMRKLITSNAGPLSHYTSVGTLAGVIDFDPPPKSGDASALANKIKGGAIYCIEVATTLLNKANTLARILDRSLTPEQRFIHAKSWKLRQYDYEWLVECAERNRRVLLHQLRKYQQLLAEHPEDANRTIYSQYIGLTIQQLRARMMQHLGASKLTEKSLERDFRFAPLLIAAFGRPSVSFKLVCDIDASRESPLGLTSRHAYRAHALSPAHLYECICAILIGCNAWSGLGWNRSACGRSYVIDANEGTPLWLRNWRRLVKRAHPFNRLWRVVHSQVVYVIRPRIRMQKNRANRTAEQVEADNAAARIRQRAAYAKRTAEQIAADQVKWRSVKRAAKRKLNQIDKTVQGEKLDKRSAEQIAADNAAQRERRKNWSAEQIAADKRLRHRNFMREWRANRTLNQTAINKTKKTKAESQCALPSPPPTSNSDRPRRAAAEFADAQRIVGDAEADQSMSEDEPTRKRRKHN